MDLCVAYVPPHQPQHVQTDIKYLKSIGCTEVLCALQENHFLWLPGAVKYSARIASDNGVKPRAVLWGFANTSGGGRNSAVMLKNPDIWRCDETGRPYLDDNKYGPQACYNNFKILELYADYVQQMYEAGFREIMIDEPSPQRCFCYSCRAKFGELYNRDLVRETKSPTYKEFQVRTVIDFAEASCKAVKMVSKDLKVSVTIMPCDNNLFRPIAEISDLDILGVDPYWLRPVNKLTINKAIDVSLDALRISEANGKQFELYLGCFGIAGGLGLEEKIYSEGKFLIEKVKPHKLTTWSFLGGLGLKNDPEECDNPHLAWSKVVQLYTECSGKL